jgi:hypothetical protein
METEVIYEEDFLFYRSPGRVYGRSLAFFIERVNIGPIAIILARSNEEVIRLGRPTFFPVRDMSTEKARLGPRWEISMGT